MRQAVDGTWRRPELHTNRTSPFFEHWPDPPSPGTHLALLRNSDAIVLAVDRDLGEVVGFVTAITDGILSAYLPLLEVRADHRGHGIGRELVRPILESLGDLYMVDVLCDPEVLPFYESLGFTAAVGAARRQYAFQAGREERLRSGSTDVASAIRPAYGAR